MKGGSLTVSFLFFGHNFVLFSWKYSVNFCCASLKRRKYARKHSCQDYSLFLSHATRASTSFNKHHLTCHLIVVVTQVKIMHIHTSWPSVRKLSIFASALARILSCSHASLTHMMHLPHVAPMHPYICIHMAPTHVYTRIHIILAST